MAIITIDKLSFTGRIDTTLYTDMLDYIQSTPYECDYRHMPWNFLYQHQWMFKHDNIFIQIGTYEKERVFRMEFNPNKLKNVKLFYDIVKRVKMPNVTRIDWAIDYEKDLSDCQFKMRIPRKTIDYKSRSGKLETKYLGSPKSDKFTRIYNKALEILLKKKRVEEDPEEDPEVKEVLWRVESVVKNFEIKIDMPVKTVKPANNDYGGEIVTEMKKVGYDYLFDNPFKNLAIYEKFEDVEGKKTLKWQEKAAIEYFEKHPEEFLKLPANTQKKYQMLKYTFGYRLIEHQPAEIFEKEKSRLANEVESLLKPALDNTKNITGDISNVHYSIEFLDYIDNGGKLKEKPFKLNKAEIFYEENKGTHSLEEFKKDIKKVSDFIETPKGNFNFTGDLLVDLLEERKVSDGYKKWLKWVEELEGK